MEVFAPDLSSTLRLSVMEKFSVNYSTKNIPFPSQNDYRQRLIEKTEQFLRRMRWKAYFFLNPSTISNTKDTYGFNSAKNPPPVEELKEFENSMLKMVQSTKFKHINSPFLNKLKDDAIKIKNETKLLIAADKTTNFYKLEPSAYNDLLEQNITMSYKKAQIDTVQAIHAENKNITTKLGIDNRVDKTASKEAFITLKDHKPNFANKPTCRLINPTKSEIGKISKRILDRINSRIMRTANFNQWKNTASAIGWFKSLKNKQHLSFICFDIEEFYPSISQDLLNKALDFASTYDNITMDERNIIIHAKKSTIIHKRQPWQKERRHDILRHDGQLRRRRNVRSSRKFPSFTATRPQHQRRTLQRRRTSHHQHHAERHRKHKEGNLPYLQPQRTTYHHRSKKKRLSAS